MPEALPDYVITQLLAAEAKAMADDGRIPDEAPGPSPNLPKTLYDVWKDCEDRLMLHGQQGCISIHDRHQHGSMRGEKLGNSRDLIFYPDLPTLARKGLFVAEGVHDCRPFKDVPLSILAQNTPYLLELERRLGMRKVVDQLQLATMEAIVNQHLEGDHA